MVHAFIMVRTGTGASEAGVEAIRGLPEVTDAHIVAGDYDIVAEVEVDDIYNILHAAASKIQGIEGISETKTYISLSD